MSDDAHERAAREHGARAAILEALPGDGPGVSLGELRGELRAALPGDSPSCAAAAYHLRVLERAGLAERREDGWRRPGH